MGTLTEQMQNLAADIRTGHEERRAWLGDFRQGCDSMRQEREASLGDLREEVDALRTEIRADMRGARRAWHQGIAASARSGVKTAPAKPGRTSSKHRK